MIVRFVIVAYCVGCLLGLLGVVEWLVSRIARVWLSFAAAALLSWAVGLAGDLVVRWRRRIAR